MSGWMKYPYDECIYCDLYDPDEDEENEYWTMVNHPYETCDYMNWDKCPKVTSI